MYESEAYFQNWRQYQADDIFDEREEDAFCIVTWNWLDRQIAFGMRQAFDYGGN